MTHDENHYMQIHAEGLREYLLAGHCLFFTRSTDLVHFNVYICKAIDPMNPFTLQKLTWRELTSKDLQLKSYLMKDVEKEFEERDDIKLPMFYHWDYDNQLYHFKCTFINPASGILTSICHALGISTSDCKSITRIL